MSNTDHWKRLTTTKTLHSIVKVSLLFAIGAGCGSAPDATLSAETYDEYTEPLTNAVIGEGNKTIVIGPAEATAPPAPDARVIPGVAGLDAGRGTGGAGGVAPVESGARPGAEGAVSARAGSGTSTIARRARTSCSIRRAMGSTPN